MKKAYSDECALLMAARMLITDRDAWTQGVFARDPWDLVCNSEAAQAAKWCLAGAILAFARSYSEYLNVCALLEPIMLEIAGAYNDRHTHKQVLAAADKAIEMSV